MLFYIIVAAAALFLFMNIGKLIELLLCTVWFCLCAGVGLGVVGLLLFGLWRVLS